MSLSSIESGLRISWDTYRCVTHKACLVASLKHATLIGYSQSPCKVVHKYLIQ